MMEELTWHDMMLIHKCIKDAMNYNLYAMSTAEGQQKVYEDVLIRFKGMRKIEENSPKFPKISPKGKPVCAFSTDRYTDEEREILCVGCKEDCQYSQESASSVLDEELNRFKKLHGPMATLERCAKHFAYWQKQMMIKDAVDGVVHHFDGDNLASIHYNDPKGVPMCYYASASGLESGDKVKLILAKVD